MFEVVSPHLGPRLLFTPQLVLCALPGDVPQVCPATSSQRESLPLLLPGHGALGQHRVSLRAPDRRLVVAAEGP